MYWNMLQDVVMGTVWHHSVDTFIQLHSPVGSWGSVSDKETNETLNNQTS